MQGVLHLRLRRRAGLRDVPSAVRSAQPPGRLEVRIATLWCHLWACAKASSRAEWNHSWNLMLKASDKMFEVSELVKLDLGLVR